MAKYGHLGASATATENWELRIRLGIDQNETEGLQALVEFATAAQS